MIQKKYFLPLVILILGILFEHLLLYLFPYTGLGAVGFVPFSYLINIIICLILYFILKNIAKNYIKILFSLVGLISILFLEIKFYKTEVGLEPDKAFPVYWKTFSKYPENIEFNDIINGNEAKRIAAIKKYKTELPDYILNLDCKNYGNYIIQVNNQTFSYDTLLISLKQTKDSTFINLKKYNKQINLSNHLLTNGVGIKIDSNNWIFIEEDHFKIETGIEKLFYTIL